MTESNLGSTPLPAIPENGRHQRPPNETSTPFPYLPAPLGKPSSSDFCPVPFALHFWTTACLYPWRPVTTWDNQVRYSVPMFHQLVPLASLATMKSSLSHLCSIFWFSPLPGMPEGYSQVRPYPSSVPPGASRQTQ